MDYDFTKGELTALKKLTSECDYEDAHKGGTDNFILRCKLAPGIGDKTLSSLEKRGLIETGLNRWSNKMGYRITDTGRKALAGYKPKPKPTKRKTRLKLLEPRLKPAPSRLEK